MSDLRGPAIIVIRPPGPLSLPRWRELWEAREVLLRLGQRDVILRYRQTVVGVAWVLIQPLVAAGIFTIVFGVVAKLPTGIGASYAVFSLTGVVAWGLISQAVVRTAPSLVANQALVSKVFFPRMLVPMSAALSVLLDFGVGLLLVVLVILGAGIGLTWAAVLVLPLAVCGALLGLGLGVAAAAITVRYRDTSYVLPWLVQVAMYASPVAYSMAAVPDSVRSLVQANPVTWYLELFRYALLGGAAPPAWYWPALGAAAAGSLLIGVLVFARYERSMADVI